MIKKNNFVEPQSDAEDACVMFCPCIQFACFGSWVLISDAFF